MTVQLSNAFNTWHMSLVVAYARSINDKCICILIRTMLMEHKYFSGVGIRKKNSLFFQIIPDGGSQSSDIKDGRYNNSYCHISTISVCVSLYMRVGNILYFHI